MNRREAKHQAYVVGAAALSQAAATQTEEKVRQALVELADELTRRHDAAPVRTAWWKRMREERQKHERQRELERLATWNAGAKQLMQEARHE
jgi:hypothetical protein